MLGGGKGGEGGEGGEGGGGDLPAVASADLPPVAALVSYEDIYVERAFSEATARLGFGLGLGLGGRLTVRVRPPSPA